MDAEINIDDNVKMMTPDLPQTHQLVLTVTCALVGLAATTLTKMAYSKFVFDMSPIPVIPVTDVTTE